MKNVRNFIGLFFVFYLIGLALPTKAATTLPMTINSQGTLGNGLQYQAKGTIASIDDISNGNLTANLLVNSGESPDTVKNLLLDGALQMNSDSTYTVESGTISAQTGNSYTFSVNSTNRNLPSLLITDVGQTQAGTKLDLRVSLQPVSTVLPSQSVLLIAPNTSDGSLTIDGEYLRDFKVNYQFLDEATHQPTPIVLFPVIGDVDYSQGFALNGTMLGAGENLTENSAGIFTSDGTGVNGLADYPLGGLLYEFYGDTLTSTFTEPDNATQGAFSIFGMYGSVKTVNVVYPQSTTTLHFYDAVTKQEIQAPQVFSGEQYDSYNLIAPNIVGYQLDTTTIDSSQLKGTYATTNTAISLYYDKQSTVTVHALDAVTGQALQAPQTSTGYATQPYQLTAPTLSGYRIDQSKSDLSALTGTYQNANQDLNLYYDQASTVTLHLNDGTTTLQTITLNGYSGDSYNYSLPNLQNYQSPPNPTVTGNFTNDAQVVTVPYVRATGTLTINYVNAQTGQALLPSEQYTNNIGDWQVIHIPNILNYDVVDTGVEVAFQQLLPDQSRTLYYIPNLDTVTVDYVDANGHPLASSQTITGYYGSSRIVKAQPISGYQVLAGQPGSYNVSFNQLSQHLVFKYQPIQTTLTLHFVNDAGQQVYSPVTLTGSYNSLYSYSPQIPWYDSLTYVNQKKITGKYTQPKTDITVQYTRRQSQLDLYEVDDRGNLLGHQTHMSFEGLKYNINLPKYKYLRLVNSKLQHFTGNFDSPKLSAVVEYEHIPAHLNVKVNVGGTTEGTIQFDGYWGDKFYFPVSPIAALYLTPYPGYNHVSGSFANVWNTINLNYNYITTRVTLNLYGTNGAYLTSYTEYGHYGQNWGFSLPSWIGNYQLAMNSYQSGQFGFSNQSYNIYYTQVVRVATQTTTYVKKPAQMTTAEYRRWTSKMGMLEYGDDSSKKLYLEYAYMNEPTLEAKVATEYHDTKPAPYYGALSVGNSSIAQSLRSTRQAVTNVVKQNLSAIAASAKKYNVTAKNQTKNKSKTQNLIVGLLGTATALSAGLYVFSKKKKSASEPPEPPKSSAGGSGDKKGTDSSSTVNNKGLEELGKNALNNAGVSVVDGKMYIDPIGAINDVENAMIGGAVSSTGLKVESIPGIGEVPTPITDMDVYGQDLNHELDGLGQIPSSIAPGTSNVISPSSPSGQGGTPNE